ncbi:MAG: ParA family protein [Desulfobacteraceae bacterium]|nr:ParA family protein [Desulfobacteraceae bacterium]
MTHTIAIATPVRQAGKTAIAVNLAVSLAVCEKRTLLIDCDPGQQAGYGTSLLTAPLKSPGFYGVMTDRARLGQGILASALPFLKILPAGADFSKADFLFGEMDGHAFHLRDRLQTVAPDFDYIIIDTPAAMPNLLKSILLASDWVLIPLNVDIRFPVRLPVQLSEITKLVSLIQAVREKGEARLKVAGIVLNQGGQAGDALETFPDDTLKPLENFMLSSHIPDCRAVRDAFAVGKPVGVHDVMSFGAMAYLDLAVELTNRLKLS